jgi:hypothetical protein
MPAGQAAPALIRAVEATIIAGDADATPPVEGREEFASACSVAAFASAWAFASAAASVVGVFTAGGSPPHAASESNSTPKPAVP